MSINSTPNSSRLHIGIFGKRNSGKSSLINAITGQDIAIVSDVAGTTSDPVLKAMEVRNVGACVFIDTAGFDDEGEIGRLRVEATEKAIDKTDIAIVVFCDEDIKLEKEWIAAIKARKTPILAVINKADSIDASSLSAKIKAELKLEPIVASATKLTGIDEILSAIVRVIPPDYDTGSIVGHLVSEGDCVMLVMPQDSEAPKGRLILPQVQITRDLLDNNCVIVSCTPETMQQSLDSLKNPPDLIITDSQAFKGVSALTPSESKLTSFSILLAKSKGDIESYIKGARAIDGLNESSHILIAEACTHAPLSEDIGRVKIPSFLKKKLGDKVKIDIVSGVDFPDDLSQYDLIIHCGGCMFNRKYLMTRIEKANKSGIPITNYGVFLARVNGILDRVVY